MKCFIETKVNKNGLPKNSSTLSSIELLLCFKLSNINKPIFIPLPSNIKIKKELLISVNELIIEALLDDSVDTVNIQFYKI